MSLDQGMHSAEQIASGILQHKMREEDIKSGQHFKLATSKRSVNVCVGRPENKQDRKDFQKLSYETVAKLRLNLDLSKRARN